MTIATNLSPQEKQLEERLDLPLVDAPAATELTDLPDDLPSLPPCNLYSDEPEMETTLHLRQMLLLILCLDWLWRDRSDYFAAGNLTVYYSQNRIKKRDFRGPDFFVVKGVEQGPRKSWTIWEEDGRYPDVIIEILSDTTAEVDRTTKKDLYQTTFRTLEYFWFDPESLEFQGFSLVRGRYQAIQATEQGWLWSDELELFLGIYDRQLRYFTPDGQLVATPQEDALNAEQQLQERAQQLQQAEQQRQVAEQQLQETEQQRQAAEQRAEQAAQRAEQEAQRAEQEARRAEQLAERLRELGINPDLL